MPTLPLLGACLVFALSVQETEKPAAPALVLENHAQLSSALKALADAHPDVVTRIELGRSRGGRALEALRLVGAGASADKARPAILLVANLDGARVFASAVALQHARALAEGYAGDEKVKALLDTTTVYVVPRANPDAAEARFATPRRELRASGPGVDDDRDGRAGEDPAADLDGDGVVGWIRVKDGDGEWREDPTDARALVKADRVKGEAGVYRLWPEGRDSDADEKVAEDDALDARVDRNFPAGWDEHGREAGVFPTDEPETRALCDFVLLHPELALVVVYDAQDTLVAELKGVGDDAPAVKRIPPAGVLESDAKLLGELGKRYKKATEGAAKAEGDDKGTFGRWCYEHRGLLVLSAALWDIPLEEKKKDEDKKKDEKGADSKEPKADAKPEGEKTAEEKKPEEPPKGEEKSEGEKGDEKKGEKGDKSKKDDEPKPSDDAKRLKWIDAAGAEEAWRFLPWKPFEHPELGPVEIGGLAPYARLEPPAAEGGALAQKHLDWFLSLGALLPRVKVAECTRERLGEGVHRVTAVVQNDAYLPLFTRSGRRTDTDRPAKVKLMLPEAGKRLGGPVQEFVEDLPGSGGRAEFTWLVQGPDAMEIAVTVETTHAGTATKVAEEKKR
jgi:zinc carboxypeptidase